MKYAILCLAIVLGISLVHCSEDDWVGPEYEGYPLMNPHITGTHKVKAPDGSYHEYQKADTGILILTDKNFDQARSDFKHLVVNFYSKYCHTWCVLFHPYYIKAHDLARKQGLSVQFAQMEWSDNKKTVNKYNVITHPTQMLFVHEKSGAIEYKGAKGQTPFLKWLTAQLQKL